MNSKHVTADNQQVTTNDQWVPIITSPTNWWEGQWPISYHNILNILVYNPLFFHIIHHMLVALRYEDKLIQK